MTVTTSPRAVWAAVLSLVLAAGLLVGLPTAADAATITVTRTDDPAPGTPGQCGSPASNGSNDCSLRQAVRRANDLAGADVVVLPAGTYTLTRVGSGEDAALTGDLDVLGDVTIAGAGSGTTTVSGAGMHGGDPDRLFHVDGVDLDVTGVTLTEGVSATLGGALRNDGGDVTLSDVVLAQNETTSEGGGALATLNGDVTITDSRFESNRTDGLYGGAIFQFAFDDGGPVTSTVTITDSVLAENVSSFYGGAIHTEAEGASTADLVIEGSQLTANTAEDCCGGAIIADDDEWGAGGNDARTNVVIRDSALTGNASIDCCGGAIYVEGTGGAPEPTVTLRIEGSNLDGNSSAGPNDNDGCCGGALYAWNASVEATDTTFNANVDDDCCGGAVYLEGTIAAFTRVEMNDNVIGSEGCCGGAAAIYGSTVTFTDSEIRGNSVGDDCCGGAFSIQASEVTFVRSTIDDNESTGCCGGAIEVGGGSTVRLLESTVSNNRETTGTDDGDLADGGGAIAMYHDADMLEVVNSTISGNSTAESGGGILAMRGTVDIVHSTITGNTAVDGGSALRFGEPAVAATAAGTVTNSIVDGTCQVGAGSTVTSGGGNVATAAGCGLGLPSDQTVADAVLGPLADNGGPTFTHALLPGSPALDAGTAATPDPVEADQRGVARPVEGDGAGAAEPDAGAVEAVLADVSLAKSVAPATVYTDTEATWTVAASNDGLNDTTVRVADVLPDGVVFIGSDDCTHDAGTVTCDLGVVPVASTVEATFTTTSSEPGTYVNTATVVLPATTTDADDVDDTASTELVVESRQNALPGGESRLFGNNRVETAVAVSNQTYADGAAGAVVLARADLYPDALAGTPLAVQEDAPLLLTSSTSLTEVTAEEIQRVLPTGGTVYLLGGTGAVAAEVEEAVEDLGYVVVRLFGDTRYETATAIAAQGLDGFGQVFLVTGINYPDAVASGAAAGAVDGAIVLTKGEEVPDETAGFLASLPDSTPVWAVGGPAARAREGDTDLVGDDRIATALLVAEQFFDDPPVAGVATGYEFPDALTGGAQLGAYGGPMLLSRPDALPDGVADYLAGLPDDATVFLYGGPAALSSDVAAAIEAARS